MIDNTNHSVDYVRGVVSSGTINISSDRYSILRRVLRTWPPPPNHASFSPPRPIQG